MADGFDGLYGSIYFGGDQPSDTLSFSELDLGEIPEICADTLSCTETEVHLYNWNLTEQVSITETEASTGFIEDIITETIFSSGNIFGGVFGMVFGGTSSGELLVGTLESAYSENADSTETCPWVYQQEVAEDLLIEELMPLIVDFSVSEDLGITESEIHLYEYSVIEDTVMQEPDLFSGKFGDIFGYVRFGYNVLSALLSASQEDMTLEDDVPWATALTIIESLSISEMEYENEYDLSITESLSMSETISGLYDAVVFGVFGDEFGNMRFRSNPIEDLSFLDLYNEDVINEFLVLTETVTALLIHEFAESVSGTETELHPLQSEYSEPVIFVETEEAPLHITEYVSLFETISSEYIAEYSETLTGTETYETAGILEYVNETLSLTESFLSALESLSAETVSLTETSATELIPIYTPYDVLVSEPITLSETITSAYEKASSENLTIVEEGENYVTVAAELYCELLPRTVIVYLYCAFTPESLLYCDLDHKKVISLEVKLGNPHTS